MTLYLRRGNIQPSEGFQSEKITEENEKKMESLEMMKNFIRERGLTGQVRELVSGLGLTSADAIEYVYDAHNLSKAAFAAKYFG